MMAKERNPVLMMVKLSFFFLAGGSDQTARGAQARIEAVVPCVSDENENDNFRFLEIVFVFFFSVFKPKRKW
jgi:hypothetical protein